MSEQTSIYLYGNQTASYTSLRTDDRGIGYTGALMHPKMTLPLCRKHACKAGDITALHMCYFSLQFQASQFPCVFTSFPGISSC